MWWTHPTWRVLYGFYYESRQCRVSDKPQLIYYKRYIDDIFAIVEAPSEYDALELMKEISFSGCKITWECSATVLSFLDVTVFRIPGDPKIHFKPYRKAMSHRERIPAISHHPLDVKRGTFLGEMSRIAALCSHYDYYIDACYELQGLYRARGYSDGLISKWLGEHKSDKWQKRHSSVRADEGDIPSFAVLKSEFNPVLNYFKAKELSDTIITSWRESMEAWSRALIPDAYNVKDFDEDKSILHSDCNLAMDLSEDVTTLHGATDPALPSTGRRIPDVTKLNSLMKAKWLVSRKRTTNLFDLSNKWKHDVLTRMNEDILNDLNVSKPRRLPPNTQFSDEPELVSGGWDEAVYPIDEIRNAPKRSMEPMSGSSKRPRIGSETIARVPSLWGHTGTSDVQVGPSAPRGLITRYVQKTDKKGKRKQN